MYTRGVRAQLVAFGVIAVLSIGYLVLGYGDGGRTTGLATYTIKADFRDTSGLYPRALVTYRGVQVGRVQSLHLTPDGVDVTMAVDSGVRVPVGARAEIHSTSAIGEQYVDLVPEGRGGPHLRAGATIPRSATREMPQIAPVLDQLNGLLESVPKEETAQLLDQVDTAFGSSALDVEQVLDSSTKLLDTATEQVRTTKQLLASVQPVLETQTDLGASTRSYIASLAGVSGELRRSDPHLRSLLANGAPSLEAVDGLLNRLTPTFSLLMANLVSTGEVTKAYLPNIKQTFVIYPAVLDRLQGTSLPHRVAGVDKLDIAMNLDDPPSCTRGYLRPSQWRDPSDTSVTDTAPNLHCTAPQSSAEAVRGARNSPCPNDPSRRSADAAGCGLVFPGEQTAPYRAVRLGPSDGGTGPAPEEGSFSYSVVTGTATWADLFTGPLR
ncbi:phospholipid/cholesterol/gamma-HCH transport system substrate-binding protein [Marmoricola sp. URHA0025 HA25]